MTSSFQYFQGVSYLILVAVMNASPPIRVLTSWNGLNRASDEAVLLRHRRLPLFPELVKFVAQETMTGYWAPVGCPGEGSDDAMCKE